MKKLGFIINPVAGIGGKVGLKGSDGELILKKALELGGIRESGKKALITMNALKEVEDELDIYTWPGEMGADICTEAGLRPPSWAVSHRVLRSRQIPYVRQDR